jgi:hypothetical protein
MAKQDQDKDQSAGKGHPPIESGEGYGTQEPQPSELAAASAGAVGPGALAAVESPAEISKRERAQEAINTGGELTHEEMETLRVLVRRVGSVDALIHWLQLHPDMK